MAQTVSAAYKAAAIADTIIPTQKLLATLVENTTLAVGATISATNTQDTTLFNVNQVTDGKLIPDAKWAFADGNLEGAGGICLADGTWYPIDTTYEGGWWSSSISDASGNMSVAQTIILTYPGATLISAITLYGDANLGYPVDFIISATIGGVLTALYTVTGNTNPQLVYTFATMSVTGVRVTITRINRSLATAVVLEFGGSLTVNATSSVIQLDVLSERQTSTSTLEIGNSSANELHVTLENTNHVWGPHDINSPYYGFLKNNRRFVLSLGYIYSDGSSELVPYGTYYSMEWRAHGGGPDASVKAQDRMKILRDKLVGNQPLYTGLTVDVLIANACQAAGLSPGDYIINSSAVVIPYAWGEPTATFLAYITLLAAAAAGVVWFDEVNRLHFEDALYLHNNSTVSVFTLTDSNAKISSEDDWNEGDVKNRITVSVNALAPATAAVLWTLQEILTVPASSTYTLVCLFQNPATGVTQTTFTNSGSVTVTSLTVYAKSAVVVFTNSSGVPQTVTAYALTGQLIQPNGQSTVTVDALAYQTAGIRTMPVSNVYIQTQAAANSIAASLLQLHQDPPAKITADCIGQPWLELGDRITVNSPEAGINSDFWLIRHALSLAQDGSLHSQMTLIAVV